MAEQRGGYRAPRDRTPRVSGPGKAARRTDNQPVSVPNVGDSEDLMHGDRQRLEQSQRMAPLTRARSPQVQAPAPGASPSPGGGSAQLPPHLFGGETTRPDEPITEGLPFGPGAGPDVLTPPPADDVRQLALEKYARVYDNPDAKRILTQLRAPVEQPVPMPAPAMGATEPGSAEPEIEDLDEDLATEEEVAVEGEEAPVEPSVETPEAAASAEEEVV